MPRTTGDSPRPSNAVESVETPAPSATRQQSNTELRQTGEGEAIAQDVVGEILSGDEPPVQDTIGGLILAVMRPAEPQIDADVPATGEVVSEAPPLAGSEVPAIGLLGPGTMGADGAQETVRPRIASVMGRNQPPVETEADASQTVPLGGTGRETPVTDRPAVPASGGETETMFKRPQDEAADRFTSAADMMASDRTNRQKDGFPSDASASVSTGVLGKASSVLSETEQHTGAGKNPRVPASEAEPPPLTLHAETGALENEMSSAYTGALHGSSAVEARPELPSWEGFDEWKGETADVRHPKTDCAADAPKAGEADRSMHPAIVAPPPMTSTSKTAEVPSPAAPVVAVAAAPPESIAPAASRAVLVDVTQPDLGHVHVRVALARDLVHASLSSDRPDVGHFFMNNHDRLQAALQASGLELGRYRVDIDGQDGGRAFQQWQFEHPRQEARDFRERAANRQVERSDRERAPARGLVNLVA